MIIGKEIIRYKEIDSTNDEARRLIRKGKGEGLVLVAEKQTRGRGKPGSSWVSPKGNIYLSAVIKPYKNQQNIAPLILVAALAGQKVIKETAKIPIVIKWPNDLLIYGKKVGGILTERLSSGHIIIGIGLNVNSAKRAVPGATSLKLETKKNYLLEPLIGKLIEELDLEYLAYLAKFC